jgi:hypothetical protein
VTLACPGLDVDQWRAANRVPLFKDQVNWWVLARTLRDNPSDDDIRNTTQAVFLKWFGGWASEAIEAGQQTSAGPATQIQVRQISRDRLTLPVGIASVARFEKLAAGPLPSVEGTPAYVLVSFAWRSPVTDAPWPTYKSPGVIHLPGAEWCPTSADWILVEAGRPIETAPPDKSWTERAGADVEQVTGEALETIGSNLGRTLGLPLFLIGAGLFGIHLFLRGKR